MSYKKQLEKLEGYFEKKDKQIMLRRKSMKKARNKWIRRSKLSNADKIYKGWEY